MRSKNATSEKKLMQQRKILVKQQNNATTTVETKPTTIELAETLTTIVSVRSRSREGIKIQHQKKKLI
jgi:hypothetical protein